MKLSRAKRERIGYLLISIGVLLIFSVIVINAIDLIKSEMAVNDFKENKISVKTGEPDKPGEHDKPGKLDKPVELDKPDEPDKPAELDEPENSEGASPYVGEELAPASKYDIASVMGLLIIPKISLEEAIREGSTKSVLSSALGHMEGTALPGEEGNCCIAGHRNYTFGKYFNRLNEMEIGDLIEIETYDAHYTYEVYDIFVVEPTQLSVLDEIEGNNLTLITCTPIFVGSHRLIIRAALVETQTF